MKKLDTSRGAAPLYLQISAILKEKILKKNMITAITFQVRQNCRKCMMSAGLQRDRPFRN